MRRRAGRIDVTQPEIVKGLRQIGCSVRSLANVGNGCADLLVVRSGKLRLLECKDGSLPPSKRKLTPMELQFYHDFFPNVIVVGSLDEAINAMVSA